MRINVSYPSAALLSRVLSTPKGEPETTQDRPGFSEAMDQALAGQAGAAAVIPQRPRLSPYRPVDKKDPRERRQNDGQQKDERPARGGSFWA